MWYEYCTRYPEKNMLKSTYQYFNMACFHTQGGCFKKLIMQSNSKPSLIQMLAQSIDNFQNKGPFNSYSALFAVRCGVLSQAS